MEKGKIDTEFSEKFKLRTRKHSVATIKFLKSIPPNEEMYVIKRQLIKSATSVAANYLATCRAKSKADFISKLGIVHEEADETLFWFEVLEDLNYTNPELLQLKKESDEILRIVAKSISTSRSNYYESKAN